jgi:protein gp37
MATDTKIQWCDDTVNPTSGCVGCELWNQKAADIGVEQTCYAGILHQTRLAKAHPGLYSARFSEVREIPGRMAKIANTKDLSGKDRPEKPWLSGYPRIIFLGDLSDVLSPGISFQFLQREVIDVAESKAGRRHLWLLLTKQASRLREFADWVTGRNATFADGRRVDPAAVAGLPGYRWPENLWAGVSVTSQAAAARLNILRDVQGPRVKFASFEPLLSAVDAIGAMTPTDMDWDRVNDDLAGSEDETEPPEFISEAEASGDYVNDSETKQVTNPEYLAHQAWRKRRAQVEALRSTIDWAIIGGSSGSQQTPIPWMAELVRQAEVCKLPAFVKQLGSRPVNFKEGTEDMLEPLVLKHPKGGDWEEWPEGLRVRRLPDFDVIGRAK